MKLTDNVIGDDFEEAAEAYLTLMFNKGVPSTFANLKHLYSDESKKQTLAELAEEYLESQTGDASSKDKGEAAAIYYLAQHHNYYLSRDLTQAMEYIDKAIEKDPKSVDFHMTKARILKHSGNLQKAAETMDHARKLDLKDRYINTKAAKYQLRNDENSKAVKTVGLFTRADSVGGPIADLLDMQCIWYLTEDGEAYARQGNIGMALKRFQAVFTIFDVWHEDQFDFHSFSLRKGQIRAYVDMIRWEDHVRDHPFFSRAALDAVDIYLKLADKPSENGVNGTDGGAPEDASAKKKAVKKAKKELQRLEREAREKQAKQDPNKANKDGEEKKKDDDPFGEKLAETADPLGEAMKFINPLLQYSPKNIDAQLAGFEVYMHRSESCQSNKKNMPLTYLPTEKYVPALRCLTLALDLDAKSPKVHEKAVAFRQLLNTATDISPKVLEVLKAEFKTIEESTDLNKYNDEYEAANKDSAPHVISAIKARKLLGQDKAKSEEALIQVLDHTGIEFTDAVEALETLKQWKSSQVEAFKKAALAKWPEVTRLA
jgi:tetratricopeptide (TPR) repeat protein